jgi:hypothetical protein
MSATALLTDAFVRGWHSFAAVTLSHQLFRHQNLLPQSSGNWNMQVVDLPAW